MQNLGKKKRIKGDVRTRIGCAELEDKKEILEVKNIMIANINLVKGVEDNTKEYYLLFQIMYKH